MPLTVAPAPLTVTANNVTATYGSAVRSYTYTITGFVNGDTQSVITGIPTINANAATIRNAWTNILYYTSPPGTYTIYSTWGSLKAANYTFDFVPGTLAIIPATTTLTVTAYSGTIANASLIPSAFKYYFTGLLGADTPTTVGTGTISFTSTATASSPAGNYTVSPGPLNTFTAPNYASVVLRQRNADDQISKRTAVCMRVPHPRPHPKNGSPPASHLGTWVSNRNVRTEGAGAFRPLNQP